MRTLPVLHFCVISPDPTGSPVARINSIGDLRWSPARQGGTIFTRTPFLFAFSIVALESLRGGPNMGKIPSSDRVAPPSPFRRLGALSADAKNRPRGIR